LGKPAVPSVAEEAASKRIRRTHVIRDRDTLASIAVRYYGSADFAGRIYAANRHVLSNPDLLPVGQSLVLPEFDQSVGTEPLRPLDASSDSASRPQVPQRNGVGKSETSEGSPSGMKPSTQLVPLPGGDRAN
jgi:phage tail protein X